MIDVETRGKAMLTHFDHGLTIYSHNQLYVVWKVVRAGSIPATGRSLRLAIHTVDHSALLKPETGRRSGLCTDAGLLVEFPDGLSEGEAICVVDNNVDKGIGRGNLSVFLGGVSGDLAISDDPEYFNCRHASLPPIEIEPPVDLDNPDTSPIDTAALCGAEGTGVNTEAFVADCPELSDYRLFADPTNPLTSGTQRVSWIDINGDQQSTDYVIPNTNNCANCHGEDTLVPIGPTARSLNKDYAYATGTANQLDYWAMQEILIGVPNDKDSIDTIPLWGDTSADLDARARGYLDVNCAHCHLPGGAGDTSGLLLDYGREFGFDVGECRKPVAFGGGSTDLLFDIVPGDADASILSFRMDSDAPEVRMPEIGRSIIHAEGVQLIRDWIDAMDLVDCSAP